MLICKAIGKVMRSCREERGWSMRKAAYELGLSATTHRRYEYGEPGTKVEIIDTLCGLYGDWVALQIIIEMRRGKDEH